MIDANVKLKRIAPVDNVILVVDLALIMAGRKRTCNFGLTLPQCDLSDYHIYFSLTDLCDEILVTRERHNKCERLFGVDNSIHYHIFMKTTSPWFIKELRDTIIVNLDPETYKGGLDIQTLKNHKHWIKYITKEDTDPLWRGVDTSLFHQAYKIHKYTTEEKENRTLLRQIPNYYKYLQEERARQQLTMKTEKFVKNRTEPEIEITDWVSNVSRWWNDSSKPGLYLWGETGTGKSSVINHLLYRDDSWKTSVRLPCGNTGFEFSGLQLDTTTLHADDADSAYLTNHRQALLQILDRGLFTYNKKCGPITTTTFTGKVIICSNFPFNGDEALQRRFTIIQATQKAVIQEEKIHP